MCCAPRAAARWGRQGEGRVKAFRKFLTRAVVLGVGCSAAVQLAAIQSPALAAPAQVAPATVARPKIQLGAGVDLYSYRGLNFTTASADDVAYLKALHANSVLVSFPFYVSGRKGSSVLSRVPARGRWRHGREAVG